MAANIITEILKKMQKDLTDQTDYMRNLHVIHKNINEKFINIEGKISHLDKKLDQMGVIKQQVQKNNLLLFGNDDKGDETVVSGEIYFYENVDKCHLVEQTDNSDNTIQRTETNELSTLDLTCMRGTEFNSENDNNKNDLFTKTDDKDKVESISKELRELKELINAFRDPAAERKPLNEEAANPIFEQMTELKELISNEFREVKKSIASVHDFVTVKNTSIEIVADDHKQGLTEFGKSITSELREIKESITSIRDFVAEKNTTIKKAVDSNNKQTTELRILIDNKLQDMKGLITSYRDNVTDRKSSQDAANTACKQKTVQISPTYFSPDQISKLNEELKRIAETHRASGVVPIVEVAPGSADEHPVMKSLRKGVVYKTKDASSTHLLLKLGLDGLKTSDIRDLLTDDPDLTLYDVVQEILPIKTYWKELSQKYDFAHPILYWNVE